MTMNHLELAIGAVIGIGVGYILVKFLGEQQRDEALLLKEYVPSPPTNAYIPNPDITEWSYQNAVRKDYEALERLMMGDARSAVGWPVSNLHPTYEDYLNTKYGFF